ncbi:putative diacylglycerol O-acyltransferase 1, partial [Hyaloscypha hepaticicola]
QSLEAFPNQMRIILKDRKGVVTLAMRTEADLVPLLVFGENELSHPAPIILGWILPKFYGTGFFSGRRMIPFRFPQNIFVGKPVTIAQQSDSDIEEVHRLHALYIARLCTLRDESKESFAPIKVGGMQLL